MYHSRTCLKVLTRLSYSARLSSTTPYKTALYELHLQNGGKLVDFGGFMLPVQYTESITSSHLHTRRKCSLFDVSHMLQTVIRGSARNELMERITTADVRGLTSGKSCLTVFTDPNTGGILDDLIITNADDHLFVVSNAGRRDHDMQLMMETQKHMTSEKKDVSVEFLDFRDQSLIALQGPEMVHVLQPLLNIPLDKLTFMSSTAAQIGGVNVRVSRCGYTGEDGVEISVKSTNIIRVVGLIMNNKNVQLAGLGARDSLRLEAGLCLYGSDIDEKVTPVEAALMWLVAKPRRERRDFPGAERILELFKQGPKKKRVGIKLEKGPPARHDCVIKSTDDVTIGHVTSGCPSPSLGGSVAMGYVETPFSKNNTQVQVEVRGKLYPATVSKMPFLPARYFSPFRTSS